VSICRLETGAPDTALQAVQFLLMLTNPNQRNTLGDMTVMTILLVIRSGFGRMTPLVNQHGALEAHHFNAVLI
jgi:hypothetical protein